MGLLLAKVAGIGRVAIQGEMMNGYLSSMRWGQCRGWLRGSAFVLLLACAMAPAAAVELAPASGESGAGQLDAINRDLAAGEKYAEISPEARSRVQLLIARMRSELDRAGSMGALTRTQNVEWFNQQEEVNQILTAAANDSRLVCRRERPTGSKMPVNTCLTVAERRRARDGGHQMMQELKPAQGPVNQQF